MTEKSGYKCPKCGYEYEPWVEVCPDCNVPVRQTAEEQLAEHTNLSLGEGDNPKWTVAANVPNAIIGSLIKSQLEDAGIPVIMMRSRSADIAEFSHNDYVPQDIRVPGHLREQARQLIYAPPDDLAFSGGAYEGEDEPDGTIVPDMSNLPEGWSLMPRDSDMRSRWETTSGRGEVPSGWHWSDKQPETSTNRETEPHEDEVVWDWRAEYGNASPKSRGVIADEEWPKSPKWIRVVYGVMLLAISLPFLFQLFEQLARFLSK